MTIKFLGGRGRTIRGGGGGSGTAYDYTVTITASRTSVEVPGPVFFDVLTTTGHNGSFVHDIATYWTFQGAARSTKRGYISSAMIIDEGSHLITCTQIDRDGRIGYGEITVTGNAFAGTTYYVDSTSVSTGDGTTTATSGANAAFNSISDAYTTLGSSADYRLLYKRGQTFTETTTITIPTASVGNTIRIGDYGSGALPIWDTDAAVTKISLGDHKDVCIYNIEARGRCYTSGRSVPWTTSMGSAPGASYFIGAGTAAGYEHCSIYGCTLEGHTYAMSTDGNPSTSTIRQLMFDHCVVDHTYQYSLFLCVGTNANSRLSIADCTLRNALGESGANRGMLRLSGRRNFELSNCNFSLMYGSTGGSDILKVNSIQGETSLHNCITDTTFDFPSGTKPGSFVKIGNEGGATNQKTDSVVFDGCAFIGDPANQVFSGIQLACKDPSFRNCTFIDTGGTTILGVNDANLATDYAATGAMGEFSVYGNSAYLSTSSPSVGGKFIQVDATSDFISATKARNNSWSAPNHSSGGDYGFLLVGSGRLSTVTHGNNNGYAGSADSATIYIKEGGTSNFFSSTVATNNATTFGNPTYVSGTNLHLQSGSPVIGDGVSIGGRSYKDKDGVLRGAAIDIGAYEYV